MNSINIMGRLTKDPIIRTTRTGESVTPFVIAINDGYGDKKKDILF